MTIPPHAIPRRVSQWSGHLLSVEHSSLEWKIICSRGGYNSKRPSNPNANHHQRISNCQTAKSFINWRFHPKPCLIIRHLQQLYSSSELNCMEMKETTQVWKNLYKLHHVPWTRSPIKFNIAWTFPAVGLQMHTVPLANSSRALNSVKLCSFQFPLCNCREDWSLFIKNWM